MIEKQMRSVKKDFTRPHRACAQTTDTVSLKQSFTSCVCMCLMFLWLQHTRVVSDCVCLPCWLSDVCLLLAKVCLQVIQFPICIICVCFSQSLLSCYTIHGESVTDQTHSLCSPVTSHQERHSLLKPAHTHSLSHTLSQRPVGSGGAFLTGILVGLLASMLRGFW